ncbi:hypothetical protein C8A03DRAFT_30680 [Achaetomium macrosporum]|uniref:Uncharacterized protein n=1 Tax=Achaetomium macrosporum TaxID=79813 RepID=A0AAN7CH50_9PEZI|nr:hypothetical protein C8A03DRAFT_30680 [Achaetomium macrosporum]
MLVLHPPLDLRPVLSQPVPWPDPTTEQRARAFIRLLRDWWTGLVEDRKAKGWPMSPRMQERGERFVALCDAGLVFNPAPGGNWRGVLSAVQAQKNYLLLRIARETQFKPAVRRLRIMWTAYIHLRCNDYREQVNLKPRRGDWDRIGALNVLCTPLPPAPDGIHTGAWGFFLTAPWSMINAQLKQGHPYLCHLVSYAAHFSPVQGPAFERTAQDIDGYLQRMPDSWPSWDMLLHSVNMEAMRRRLHEDLIQVRWIPAATQKQSEENINAVVTVAERWLHQNALAWDQMFPNVPRSV